MLPVTERELRESFINCSKGERAKIPLPSPLAGIDFAELDFLGWRDPKAPERGYVVADIDGRPVGLAMRAATKGAKNFTKSTMCSICLTPHTSSGVTLFTAALRGESGRNGNTVGNYMCSDLQCSRYVRGTLRTEAIVTMAETLDPAERIARLSERMAAFVARVEAG
jgi:hypothetical protein